MTDKEIAEALAAKEELETLNEIRRGLATEFKKKRPKARSVHLLAGDEYNIYTQGGRLRLVNIGAVKELYPILLEIINHAIDEKEAYLESL